MNTPLDYDGDPYEGYVTEERCEEAFSGGAQAMREMLARFIEQGGDTRTAESIRANWNPSWGNDPGKPENVANNAWDV